MDSERNPGIVRGRGYWPPISRRTFLKLGAMSTAALALGSCTPSPDRGKPGGDYFRYGPLVEDPGGVLDLPEGFQYRIISEEGNALRGGAPIPTRFDGMAAFRGAGNTTVLIRNHELEGGQTPLIGNNPFDSSQAGGTIGIVVGEDRKKVEEFAASCGTVRNCAGGATPWGTWLTCEETEEDDGHGYVFEVMPGDPENGLSRTPIQGMGLFSHEAVGVDPDTGVAYLTEDSHSGASFLYRYIPEDPSSRPGSLQRGGKLQALTLEEPSRKAKSLERGRRFGARWIDVDPGKPHEEALSKGAVRFKRLEGACFSGGTFWFDDTTGGVERRGQIYRYRPEDETLELFYEGTEANGIESPDNIVVSPWGDLLFAEDEAIIDGDKSNRILGLTPQGGLYEFARCRVGDTELAGPTFSPDGQTFFVNIFKPGMTLAIWGPFMRGSAARRRQMAFAAPPAHLAPELTGELVEAAARLGMSALEAAAYDRLAVPLV
jgi:secreted PhoX family phosphatase